MTRSAWLLVTLTLSAGCASEPAPEPAPAPVTERPGTPPEELATGPGEDDAGSDPSGPPWPVSRCEEGLASPDARVRRRAALELGGRASDAPDEAARLVPALARHLADASEDAEVRWRAAYALGALGERAGAAVPALVTALDGPDEVQAHASEALGHVGRREAVAPLVDRLGHADADVRAWAAATLARLGPVAGDEATRAKLALALDDASSEVRAQAATALLRTGAGAEVAPRALRLLDEPDAGVRGAAIGLLAGLRPAPPEVVTALAGALRDADPRCRGRALSGLAQLGPAAAPAVDAISALLSDPAWADDALRALTAIGPAGGEVAARVVLDRLRAADWAEEDRAWDALARLGRPGAAALGEGLASRHRTVRLRAAQALADAGPDAEAARGVLEEASASERFHDVLRAMALALVAAGGDPAGGEPVAPDEEADGPYTADAALPGPPTNAVRPGGHAKQHTLDLLARSPLTEEAFDWAALLPALTQARALPADQQRRAIDRARADHLRPDGPAQTTDQVVAQARRRLFDLTIEELSALVGEPLLLGDLVQTGDYRAVWMYLVGERPTKGGRALRLIDPRREEDSLTAPSYLCYPTVIPSLDFWGDRDTVEAVPLDPAFARGAVEHGRLVIGARSFYLEPEQARALADPATALRPYVHLGAESVLLLDPAQVDRAPPLEAP